MEQFRILCLDDEKIVLSALKRELELNPRYRVFTAGNGETALCLAKEKAFDAYLVDQYMGGMDGVTFMRQLKDIYPDALVFFLTGQDFDGKAHKASLVDNETGGAYYFTKPWNESLYVGLAQALKSRHEKKVLTKENQKLNHWIAKFFEEAPLVQLLTEKPSLDTVLDRLHQRLMERDLVHEAYIYLLSGSLLELLRSPQNSPTEITANHELALQALSQGSFMQKTGRGWNYFAPIGIKKQKVGLVHLRLKRMEEDTLQFIDYIIYQGGVMIEQVLIQIQLENALKELEIAQNELLETEKNNLITGLARWLMHNVNNILCGIKGDNDLINLAWQTYKQNPHKAKDLKPLILQLGDSLPAMDKAIQRLIQMTEDFRFIAHISKAKTQKVEFNLLIKGAAQKFGHHKKIDAQLVNITGKYDSALELVEVNREMVIRMLEEILNKALESLPPAGGKIEIRTKNINGWAEIVVSDSGQSLAADSRQWLQEPLFSTNIPLETGGMELVIIKEAVNFHRGEINFTSKIGSGNQITVRLPLVAAKAARNKAKQIKNIEH